jgi:hypothetical protein
LRRALGLVGLVGCAFSPATLPSADGPATTPDGPVSASDAPAPDAATPDAPTVDAAPNPCPGPLGLLRLFTPVTGNLGGASLYTPTCSSAGASGGEDFYRLDTTGMPDTDLVFDVTEDPGLDSILDVTSACEGGAGGLGLCSGIGAPGAGEVVVVPFAMTGTRFIAVDSAAGSSGGYTLSPFLRAVVSHNGACDPQLLASRCTLGNYCVDIDNNGTTTCETLSSLVSSNTGGLAAACNGPPKATDDVAVLGSLGSAAEVDVVELAPAHDARLRVIVDDGMSGGCPMDATLEVVSGGSCQAASTILASDDNSGLGPCPRLEDVQLSANTKTWLRIQLAPGAPVQAATYSMVIDFY